MGAHLGQWRREPANRRHPRLDRLGRHAGARRDRPQPGPVPRRRAVGGRRQPGAAGRAGARVRRPGRRGREGHGGPGPAARALRRGAAKRVPPRRLQAATDHRRPGRSRAVRRAAVRHRAQRDHRRSRAPADAGRARRGGDPRAGQQGVADHRRPLVTSPPSPGRSCRSTPSTRRWPSACAAGGRRGAPARPDGERWPVPRPDPCETSPT